VGFPRKNAKESPTQQISLPKNPSLQVHPSERNLPEDEEFCGHITGMQLPEYLCKELP